VFPKAEEVLKAREGSLAETPLPLLLHALLVQERTVLLELKVRQLEKKISFEEGNPVGCTTNLLHETFGKFLVERGKLTEAQYQQTLAESITQGVQHGELLVKHNLISAFDLYKQLQANLAIEILDAFRWQDATYKLITDTEATKSPIKMNPLQLVLTGCTTALPFETVATHLVFDDSQRFGLVPNPPHELSDLKLTAKDSRLVQALRHRPTFAEVLEKGGFETEPAMRRLYALAVMGFIDFADALPQPVAPPAQAAASAPAAVPPPVLVTPPTPAAPTPVPVAAAPAVFDGIPYADGDDSVKNALMTEYLEHRKKDPFDLLGVPETFQVAALRKAFLVKADRFSPVRFKSADLQEKAGELLAAYARAFGALSDADQLALHKKRRQIAQEQA
jgi:hypothetical protein